MHVVVVFLQATNTLDAVICIHKHSFGKLPLWPSRRAKLSKRLRSTTFQAHFKYLHKTREAEEEQ